MNLSYSLNLALIAIVLLVAFLLPDFIPYEIKSFSYALSLSIKEVLIFILPFVVFSVVFHSTSNLKGSNALKTVILLLAMVAISNSASVGVACVLSNYLTGIPKHEITQSAADIQELLPLYSSFSLPSIVSSAQTMFLGFLCGIVLPKIGGTRVLKVSEVMYKASLFALEKVFAPIVPIFILGLTFKMESEGMLGTIQDNAKLMLYIFFSAFAYSAFLYWVVSEASLKRSFTAIRNMIPAVLTGFGTMSSLITMPVTLSAVKKNSNNPEIADIAVSGSVNIHLLGDCFFSVMLLSLVASTLGTEVVSTPDYAYFLMYVVLMKFAEAAVAGTGLVLMFPAIEQYLHFSPTMLSLCTTLCILLDPLITAVNVFGNGAFSLLFIKAHELLFRKPVPKK